MSEDSEKEVRITYETLYEILRREKNKDELQKLDETFYADVLSYLEEKNKMLQEAAGKFDMFSVDERDNTQVQLNNVRKILKELYERREKKIIETALNKSRTNSSIIDTTNLLESENAAYTELVRLLNGFRKDILSNLLEIRAPVLVRVPPTEPQAAPEPAAMQQAVPEPAEPQVSAEPAPQAEPQAVPEPAAEPPAAAIKKLKFTQKVEQFVGKELELYGPFEPEQTAELPADIADILIGKGSAVQEE
jgi:DNA replication initiation complex subunit (GINS family)